MIYKQSPLAVSMLVLLLASPGIAAGDKYDLREDKNATSVSRISAQLDVTGSLISTTDDKETKTDLTVSAKFGYDERVFSLRTGRMSLRHYENCDAEVRVGKGSFQPQLRPTRKLVGVLATGEQAKLFCPAGCLTRQELDLIDIPGNTAVLTRLLPDKLVEIESSWKVATDALAMLLGIDSVSTSDVHCVLWKVTPQQQAKIKLAGHVDGAIHGAATEITLEGRFDYDLNRRGISHAELSIKEIRGRSHVGPGLDVTAKVKIDLAPLRSSPELTLAKIRSLDATRDASFLLSHASGPGGFQLQYSRQWHVVDNKPGLLMLRLVKGGELVAQSSISPAKKAAGGKRMTLEEYQRHVRQAVGDHFRKYVSINSSDKTDTAPATYKIVVEGQAEEQAVRWVYYLLSDDDGNQVAVVFTVEKKRVDQFGTAGENLVQGLRIGGPATVAGMAQRKGKETPKFRR